MTYFFFNLQDCQDETQNWECKNAEKAMEAGKL